MQRVFLATMVIGISFGGLIQGVAASNEDVDAVILQRIQDADGDLVDKIYRSSFGQQRPARMAVEHLSFEGGVNSEGIQFDDYQAVPARPLVVKDSTLFNCNDRETSQNIGVSKSSSNSHSWSNSNSWTQGHKVSVSQGWEFTAKSPVAEGKHSVNVSAESYGEVSGSETTERAVTETLQWNDSASIPVREHASVRVQYVVQEEKRDVPYHVDFIARGATELAFKSTDPDWYYADWRGRGDHYNGRVLVADKFPVCTRRYNGSKTMVGKVDGAYCRIGWGSGKNPPERWKLNHKSHDVKVLAAKKGSFDWVDADVSRKPGNAVRVKNYYVCAVEVNGELHPGYNQTGRDDCVISFGKPESNKTQRHYHFKFLVGGERRVATFKLEDYLKAVDDRTFTVNGVYKGVVAVDSQFRVDAPKPLETCGVSKTVHMEEDHNPSKTMAIKPAKTMSGHSPTKVAAKK